MDTAPYPPALVENLEKGEDEDKSPYKTRGGSCQSLLPELILVDSIFA